MYGGTLATLIIYEVLVGFVAAQLTKNTVRMHHAQDGSWRKLL